MKRSLVLLGILVLLGAAFSEGMPHRHVSYKDNDRVAEIWHDSSKMATVEIHNSMDKRGGLNYLTDCGILSCSLYLTVSAESALGIAGAASNPHATYMGTYYKTTERFEVREPIYETVEEEYSYEECANTTTIEDGENKTIQDCREVAAKRNVMQIAGYTTRMEEREVWKDEPARFNSREVEVRIDFAKDDPSAKVDLFAIIGGAKVERWAWWDSDWLYKAQVNLTSGVSETLADYPAHFQMDTATLIGSGKMDSDCGDVRVLSCNESEEVPFELTNCDDANTNIYARATLEPSPAQNCVYVYYGNPGAGDGQDVCNVWSNNFTRVYHFEDGSYPGSAFDSSCHANGTYNGTGYLEEGKWGDGVRLAASWYNFVEFPNTYEWGDGNASFSIWAMANSSQYLMAKIFSLVSAYTHRTGLGGWSVKMYTQSNIASSYMADVIVEPVPSGETSMNGRWDSWMLWSAMQNVSGYGSAMFVDGGLVATQLNGKVNDGYFGVHIGNDYIYQDRTWRGVFDEYRESNVTRSANWTMAESVQGYVVGNEQSPDSTLAQTSFSMSPSTIYVDTVDVTCSVTYDSSEDEELTASMGLAINGTLIGAFNVTNSSYQSKAAWNYTFSAGDYTNLGVNFSCWSEANDSATSLGIGYTENKSVANLVPHCMAIDEAGIFELEGDIHGADAVSGVSGITGACVVINHAGVTLNCTGQPMDANNSADAAGILVNATGASILNCPSISSYERGVYFHNVQQGAVENTTVHNSSQGISLYASSAVNVTNCTAHNSTKGIMLDGATGSILDGNVFFQNEYDFYAGNSNYTMLTNYFTPDGTFANYTNLTAVDAGAPTDVYIIDWSADPGSPGDFASFAQKFANISPIGGSPSIDELNWSWDDSEIASYKEESLSLHLYNSTGDWTTLNDTPDTTNNALTLYDLEPEGVYGIFDSNLPPVAENVTLNTTLGHNTPDENLTLYWDSYDTNGNRIKNITNWYVGYLPIAALNMPFEGGSTSEYTKDYSNHSNDGTVTGAAWNATGGYDGHGAYHFDGGDYITASGSSLNKVRGYTMSVWFNTSDKGRDHFVLSWGSNQEGGRRSMFVQEGTGYLGFSGYSADLVSATDVADGQWHLLNIVHASGDLVTLYVDGIEVASDELSLAGSLAYTATTIGADPEGAQNANADIDDVVIFSRPLGPGQISALYENRTDVIVPGETQLSETWHACVTPNDGTLDGNETCSAGVALYSLGSCAEIMAPGDYTLANNIEGIHTEAIGGGILEVTYGCVVLTNPWINLDCNGYAISNNGTSLAAGIVIRDEGSNVSNCPSISDYKVGVHVNNVENIILDNLTTVDSTAFGIYIYSSSFIRIINSTTG